MSFNTNIGANPSAQIYKMNKQQYNASSHDPAPPHRGVWNVPPGTETSVRLTDLF